MAVKRSSTDRVGRDVVMTSNRIDEFPQETIDTLEEWKLMCFPSPPEEQRYFEDWFIEAVYGSVFRYNEPKGVWEDPWL